MFNEIPSHKGYGNNLRQHYSGDAGYDIKAGEDKVIAPCTSAIITTGLHVFFPEYLQMIIKSRSGVAVKSDVECSNAGVIDSGYTGAILIKLYNFNANTSFAIKTGDRIAQAVFQIRPEGFFKMLHRTGHMFFPNFGIKEVESLASLPLAQRDSNGFGSTNI